MEDGYQALDQAMDQRPRLQHGHHQPSHRHHEGEAEEQHMDAWVKEHEDELALHRFISSYLCQDLPWNQVQAARQAADKAANRAVQKAAKKTVLHAGRRRSASSSHPCPPSFPRQAARSAYSLQRLLQLLTAKSQQVIADCQADAKDLGMPPCHAASPAPGFIFSLNPSTASKLLVRNLTLSEVLKAHLPEPARQAAAAAVQLTTSSPANEAESKDQQQLLTFQAHLPEPARRAAAGTAVAAAVAEAADPVPPESTKNQQLLEFLEHLKQEQLLVQAAYEKALEGGAVAADIAEQLEATSSSEICNKIRKTLHKHTVPYAAQAREAAKHSNSSSSSSIETSSSSEEHVLGEMNTCWVYLEECLRAGREGFEAILRQHAQGAQITSQPSSSSRHQPSA